MTQTFVFPHIPKCGGTSLLRHFEASDLRLHIDYHIWPTPEVAEKARSLDLSEVDLVYGHFPIERYERPGHKYIALVRDPVERAFSAYVFHRDEGLRMPWNNELYFRIGRWIARGELSFIEFLLIAPNIRTVYQRLMAGWPKERFCLVGTTERYDEFMERLSALLGRTFSNTIRERKRKRNDLRLTEEDRQRARHLLADEYRWYNSLLAS